ncbi:MAG: NUDIX pyrophosphatase [Methanomassiliicoccales archaeon]
MFQLRGHPLSGGHMMGRVVLYREAGFLDEVRKLSVQPDHDQLPGRIAVFGGKPLPGTVGECIGSSWTSGGGGVLVEEASDSVRQLLMEEHLPAVSGISPDYFQTGDLVRMDGSTGQVELENVFAKEVVTCLVQSGGKTLILKRSDLVGSFQRKWASVSGYIEENETPYEAALKEIREELSVSDPVLVRRGSPVISRKEGTVWISHPFLFSVALDTNIKIDWEHTDFRWITLNELSNYDTVPGLNRLIDALGLK